MGNIIKTNGILESILKLIEGLGCAVFIMIGIIGCYAMESKGDSGETFGWSFVVIGVLLSLCMYYCRDRLSKSGGSLTRRRLSDEDLKGLKKEELEQLVCHIYAKNGYNFNVNDGLHYLVKVFEKFISIYPNGFSFNLSNLSEPCSIIGCSEGQLIIVLQNYNQLSKEMGRIEMMSEEERNSIRESFESTTIRDIPEDYKYGYLVGHYNRDGVYGHEGDYYYYFKQKDWYKPTTNNIHEVYSKMSEIEKYNIEFIKTYESKCCDI